MTRTRKKSAVVRRRRKPGELMTARASIRNHCLECCGYSMSEVADCTSRKCWLWPYRLGPRVRPDSGG